MFAGIAATPREQLAGDMPLIGVIVFTLLAGYIVPLLIARYVVGRDLMTSALQALAIGGPSVALSDCPCSAMRADLMRNCDAALADANHRGVLRLVHQLEALLKTSVATISVNPKLFRNMALSQNYMSYYRAVDLQLRRIAEREYHAHRSAVDEKIHTGYRSEIVNAVLSPDGRDLTNYGAISLELQDIAIEDRASLLRENAFDFYERNDLGRRDAKEEPGWRSVWADRVSLALLTSPQR